MPGNVENRLAAIRQSRGIGAADLAKTIGVSRQTIYAIEAGSYMPNTEVTLRLARTLQVPVEEIFSLAGPPAESPELIAAEVLSPAPSAAGQSARICRVGEQWVSVPVNAAPCFLPEADAVFVNQHRTRAELAVFGGLEPAPNRLVLAGCDPAIGLVTHSGGKSSALDLIAAPASSRLALRWLKQGKVHIAGTHLRDPKTGEFNLPFIRRELAGTDYVVVTFAQWEEGFATAPGNPKEIRDAAALARRGVRFVNRETGSGSRALLDQLLKDSGVPTARVDGYGRVTTGHLAAAYTVLSGDADACLVTGSAARAFGLDFVPLHTERYDFVLRKDTLQLPAAQAFLELLQRASLRRKLSSIAGYDTAHTGAVIA